MSERVSVQNIRDRAKRLGMSLQTNAPGDGKLRYSFDWPGGHFFCLGSREADIFLVGFVAGQGSIEAKS